MKNMTCEYLSDESTYLEDLRKIQEMNEEAFAAFIDSLKNKEENMREDK